MRRQLQLKHRSNLIGMHYGEFLTSLIEENREILAINVFPYKCPEMLQNRIAANADEQNIIDSAMRLRSSTRLPFWDALMLSCFGCSGDARRLFVEAMLHQLHQSTLRRIPREEIVSGRLNDMCLQFDSDSQLSFSSKFELQSGDILHLPLVDFNCPVSDQNETVVSEVAHCLLPSGAAIFVSGESYHIVGLELVDLPGLLHILARSILFSPIVDARYVAHQIIEGACALRLSRSNKKPHIPRLVRLFSCEESVDRR